MKHNCFDLDFNMLSHQLQHWCFNSYYFSYLILSVTNNNVFGKLFLFELILCSRKQAFLLLTSARTTQF